MNKISKVTTPAGEIRVTQIDFKLYISAHDVLKGLGYSSPVKVLHRSGVEPIEVMVPNPIQPAKETMRYYITLEQLHRLIQWASVVRPNSDRKLRAEKMLESAAYLQIWHTQNLPVYPAPTVAAVQKRKSWFANLFGKKQVC